MSSRSSERREWEVEERAQRRGCGKIPAPVRDPHKCFHSHKIHVEDVVIPRKDCRSRSYAFVTSKVNPSDICTFYSGKFYVKSRQIYLRELDRKNDTALSDDSVSSEYINNMDQMIEDLDRQIDENEQQIKKHQQKVPASIQ